MKHFMNISPTAWMCVAVCVLLYLRVKARMHFWESQFTQQALRKHFSCHDSIATLRWWYDGEGVGRKLEETERDVGGEYRTRCRRVQNERYVVKEACSSSQLNKI